MVNRRRNFTLHFYLMAVLVMVALGSVNYLGTEYRARLDLTEDNRFTLSEGTERLFEKLTEPVTVTYFVDAEPPAKRINLERDVVDKLDELAVSSGGKLQYGVERIANENLAKRREELEELGVRPTLDVLTTGTDERAEMRGIQGYYSSIVIRYGTSEPRSINGVVNLVDPADEDREHRVDTLEFDIAYAVLTMRNITQRPSFGSLLGRIDSPVQIALFVSKTMPPEYVQTKSNVNSAVDQMMKDQSGEIDFARTEMAVKLDELRVDMQRGRIIEKNPFSSNDSDALMYVTPFNQNPRTFEVYTTFLLINVPTADGMRSAALADFTEDQTPTDVTKRIQDIIWELYRPRTRLGFILPPHDPRARPQQPGQPPINGHTGLLNYIQTQLAYETVWVDLQKEKRVPRDLACLIVMEANLLGERELYEIDRFLAEGGNVVMLVQGWSAKIDLTMLPQERVPLSKEPMEPHFEEWLGHIGVTIQQDLLLRPNAKLQPFAIKRNNSGEQYLELVPGPARLAPIIQPKDLNPTSVFTRGLAAAPLPLPVEVTVDEARVGELEIEKTELIRLKDDVYRFIPENPSIPEMPVSFDVGSKAEVSDDEIGEPAEGIRAQKLDHDPLIATVLTGEFPSLWVDERRKIPGWNGDPEETDAPPVEKKGRGNLLIVGTAAALNQDYLSGYARNEVVTRDPRTGEMAYGLIINRGLTFYRNVSEAFIYGEDLVSLRARTGVAPRIVGPVDDQSKVLWFLFCIAGVPAILMGLAGFRTLVRTREREEYESALGIPQREEKK